MARLAVLLIIGVLLLIAVVFIVSKVSDTAKGHGGTIGKIALLIAIAAIAFWYLGEGLVVRYFSP